MKVKFFSVLGIMAILLSLVSASPAASSKASVQNMPANPEKILELLIRQGKVSVNAPKEAQEQAVMDYLRLKMAGGGEDKGRNPLARKQIDAAEATMGSAANNLHGRKLGKQGQVDPSTPDWKSLEDTDNLLLILVDFSDTPYYWEPITGTSRTEAGPLYNEIPEPTNTFDLWVEDFSPDHYQAMMFTPGGWTIPAGTPYYAGEKRGSMYDYFLQQSFGKYTVEGDTYGWFTVDKPEAYYGDDHPFGGNDNLLPGVPSDLLSDAVDKINTTNAIDWEFYSTYYTGTGCVIDHPLFIHAGIDQSGGGGAQGDDSIWAHSSSTWKQVGDPSVACPEGTFLYNYTIMPEDGGVGVFAHEFAHDLGLPDEYDTIYSGRGDSNGFWTLQSSGSWIGRPAQTQPAGMSAWAKFALGWLATGDNLAVTHVDDLTSSTLELTLDQAERWGGTGSLNGLRINLPQKYFFVNTPHSGVFEWFGGKADQIDTTLVRTVDLSGATSAMLNFWTWYEIEQYWDFGFVQVSTDGGTTWTSLPIAGTTSTFDPSGMPSIGANLPGFTGSSGGWVEKSFDLSDYAGQEIMLQFRYMTDWGTSLEGFYIDDISVSADGTPLFTDDVETPDAAWTADGWTREAGSGLKTHYYIMEYRNLDAMQTPYESVNIVNFDNGLKNAYSFDPYGSTGNVDEPWYFSYSQGLMMWYRDFSYTDNWTGAHPGHGFLLVVDAHPSALMRPPFTGNAGYGGPYVVLPWNTRIQTYDSAFGLKKAPDIRLGYWGKVRNYHGQPAVPVFDDKNSYWNKLAPDASVITPQYGLTLRVTGEASDNSAAALTLGRKTTPSASALEEAANAVYGYVWTFLSFLSR